MIKRALLFLIRAYQLAVSPYHAPCCRFTPTCSAYALQAIERFGAFYGTALAAWRLLRCNPFSTGGWDPVPETLNFSRIKPNKHSIESE